MTLTWDRVADILSEPSTWITLVITLVVIGWLIFAVKRTAWWLSILFVVLGAILLMGGVK